MRYRLKDNPNSKFISIFDTERNHNVIYMKDDILDVVCVTSGQGYAQYDDEFEVLNERTGYHQYLRRCDLNKYFEQITNNDATQYYLDLFQKMMEERSSDVLGHEMIEIGDAESIIETLLYDRELQIVPEEMIDMGYRVEDIH